MIVTGQLDRLQLTITTQCGHTSTPLTKIMTLSQLALLDAEVMAIKTNKNLVLLAVMPIPSSTHVNHKATKMMLVTSSKWFL
jgi:hypothetical protein